MNTERKTRIFNIESKIKRLTIELNYLKALEEHDLETQKQLNLEDPLKTSASESSDHNPKEESDDPEQ